MATCRHDYFMKVWWLLAYPDHRHCWLTEAGNYSILAQECRVGASHNMVISPDITSRRHHDCWINSTLTLSPGHSQQKLAGFILLSRFSRQNTSGTFAKVECKIKDKEYEENFGVITVHHLYCGDLSLHTPVPNPKQKEEDLAYPDGWIVMTI